MIKVVAKHTVKANQVQEFINLARTLVEDTNQKDEGCIHYDLYQDLTNPQVLTMLEEWESQEALDQHSAAEHFKEIVPKLGALTEGPADVNFYKKA